MVNVMVIHGIHRLIHVIHRVTPATAANKYYILCGQGDFLAYIGICLRKVVPLRGYTTYNGKEQEVNVTPIS